MTVFVRNEFPAYVIPGTLVSGNADGTYSCVSHGEHGREGLHVGQVPHADLRTERRREETERTPA